MTVINDSDLEETQSTPSQDIAVNHQVLQCSSQNLNHIQNPQAAQNPQLLVQLLQNCATVALVNRSASNFLNLLLNQVSPVVPGVKLDNPASVEDWHQSVSPELRCRLLLKIDQQLYQTTDISTLEDVQKIFNEIAHARKIESDVYNAANSRDEYYQLLAEKIYETQCELLNKQQERKEMELQQIQQVDPSLGPMIPNNPGAQSPKLPVTSAILHSRLPNFNIPANEQRMTPSNRTVQKSTAVARSSDTFSPPGSQLFALNSNQNITNQNQFNQPQVQHNFFPSCDCIRCCYKPKQYLGSIAKPVTTLTNATIDATSVPTIVDGISVSQSNSALQQTQPQMTDAYIKYRQRAIQMINQQQQHQFQQLPSEQQSSQPHLNRIIPKSGLLPLLPSHLTALQISQSSTYDPQSQQSPRASSVPGTHCQILQQDKVQPYPSQLQQQPIQAHSNVKPSQLPSVLNVDNGNEEFKPILTLPQEGVTLVNQADMNQSITPASSTSDQGSVRTGSQVFVLVSQESAGESNCSEEIEINSEIKSESGKSEAVMNSKSNIKIEIRKDIKHEPLDGGYATGSSTKDESITIKECSTPIPTDSNAESKPDSFSETSQPSPQPRPNIKSPVAQSKRSMPVFKDFYPNGSVTDVTLNVQSKEFHAHKIVLASRSAVFASMLQQHDMEKSSGIVYIPDCDPDTFASILIFLYSGELYSVSFSKVINLYKMADKYGLKELQEQCIYYMNCKLSVDSFCDVICLANMYNESELLEAAMKYFLKNASSIKNTRQWSRFLVENPILSHELFIVEARAYLRRKAADSKAIAVATGP